MKVYIVKQPSGNYEDYQEEIVKVFFNKEKAEQFVIQENKKLPLAQAEKCEHCEWRWKMCFETKQTKPKCYNPDKYETCEDYFKFQGVYSLVIEEYDVEE